MAIFWHFRVVKKKPHPIQMDVYETLDELRKIDTPTVCNALEMIHPERRAFGYTTEHLYCHFPKAEPIVGFAKTATVRSLMPSGKDQEQTVADRVSYYRYIADGDFPKVCVMQDLDGLNAGHGAFWGQFNSNIHRALNCKGVITDGAVRDLNYIPANFQLLAKNIKPSHGYIHIVDFGNQVNVCSMVVVNNDLVHADLHGAVCFPFDLATRVIQAAREFVESERPIIEACQKEQITIDEIIDIYTRRTK
jgi:regulator of RNase E activity RraA